MRLERDSTLRRLCRSLLVAAGCVMSGCASASDPAAKAAGGELLPGDRPPSHTGAAVGKNDGSDHQLGMQYSPLRQITAENVANLDVAWTYHTGDVPPDNLGMSLVSFQDQPTLVEGNLIVCSISRRIIALDPTSGEQRWQYDPQEGGDPVTGTQKCRGITTWTDATAAPGAQCRTRLLLGTADYRLVAIDAASGKPCEGFGDGGVVKMPTTKPELFPGEVVATSAPAVVNDVVVVGSAVADNQRVDSPSGRVLAFDVRTGELLWEFDPIPRDPADPAMASWEHGTAGIGGGNVWSSMAVDHERDLVFLPTTSPSGDFFGGNRPGDNHYTNSVVALRGKSGEVAWHQQLVHHNVFDYDMPTRPMLLDFPHNGELVPAVLQNTKMGLIFVFHRETGEPLIPIEERPVPQQPTVPGETLSPTQPFPVGMPAVMPLTISPEDAWGFTPFDRRSCRRKIESLVHGPIYTPPTEQGTIFFPSMGGGPNWGGAAYDPDSQLMVVPTNRVPSILKLVPPETIDPTKAQTIEMGGSMTFVTQGSPYAIEVTPLLSPLGAPCSAPPWAALTAVDLAKREIAWEVPLGSLEKMMPVPIPLNYGTPGAGGPLATAGGLVFIGYTLDDKIRAFDLRTGEVLWSADLPAAGTAIPVTYEVDGEQYVVIAAGGHSMYGSTLGDAVVAFKLKRD